MKNIMITGVTGGLGHAVAESLLLRYPASSLYGLARDPQKASDLSSKGLSVRKGDYLDYSSLVESFKGIDKLFLVSAVAFTDRVLQHKNVFQAAKEAGVKHVFYTSIFRKAGVSAIITSVTESDIETEEMLKASGLDYTIVEHPLYSDSLPVFIGNFDRGLALSMGSGKMPFTSRQDLGEASAALLTQDGHENKTYYLNSGISYSTYDLAQSLSLVMGKKISVQEIAGDEYIEKRVEEGVPRAVASFFNDWLNAIRLGAFDEPKTIMGELIGRQPKSLEDVLREVY